MKIDTKYKPIHSKLILIAGLFLLTASCEKGYFPTPAPPKTAQPTTELQAAFVNTPPLTLTDAYWKTADYLKVSVLDLAKNGLYPDGMLNMTGTFNGLTSFNKGVDPNVIMKAAYDNNKIYLYLEWTDIDLNAASGTSILFGAADPLKTDSTEGWTSQGNSDKIALAFDIANASSPAGTFKDKGCAAACHLNKMQPESGSVDIWNWDLALSEPLGYARDMFADASTGFSNDAGKGMFVRNLNDVNNPRSGPAFEWDGAEQSYSRPDGKNTLLDPAFFLLNKTAFTGDLEKGKATYLHKDYGCNHCHGDEGGGEGHSGEGTAFNVSGFASKYSRNSITTFASSELHTGQSYWNQVPGGSQADLVAYIRALGGIPGNYLTTPDGSSSDIWAVSNVTRSRINTIAPHTLYKVLLVRDLKTNNSDDVQFVDIQGKSYVFGLALMNADGKNHIGSLKQTLTFLAK